MSIEDVDEIGCTPLVSAIMDDNLDNCCWLLKKGANIAVQMNDGMSLLHVSSQIGRNTETLDWVLIEGAKVGLSIEDIDKYGFTPLAGAIIGDKLDNCRWFLEKGANMAMRMKDGRTLLHISSQVSRNTNTLAWVFTEGLKKGLSIEDIDTNGLTPLAIAIMADNIDNFRWLLAKGANMAMRMKDQRTLLHVSSQFSKNTNTLALVFIEGAKVGLSIEDVDEHGATALLCTAAAVLLDNVKWLLARGADLNTRTNKQLNVLHACSNNGCSNVLEYLLEIVPIEMLDVRETVLGLTPLLLSSKLKHSDCVRLLATKAVQLRHEAVAAVTKVAKDKAAAREAKKTCCSCGITFGVVLKSCACYKKRYCSTLCQAACWAEHKAECIMWRREIREAERAEEEEGGGGGND